MRARLPVALIATAVIIAAGLVTGWLILWDRSASAPQDQATESTDANKETVNPEEHNRGDAGFAKKMLVHSQQGVEMASIASKNAASEDVRQLATSVREALSSDIKQYTGWLNEWNEPYTNLSDFPEMDGHDMYPTYPGMASYGDITSLEAATGNTVDDMFLRLMIAHHDGAAQMASSIEFKEMQFGELIKLKNETLKKQAEEIQRMKQLQTERE
jgi:uncharacterized protein (DUF305 family)